MTVEDWAFDEEPLSTREELLVDYYNELHRTHYVVEKWLRAYSYCSSSAWT